MLIQFLLETFNFIIHVLSAFFMLIMSWIIFDSRASEAGKHKSLYKLMQSIGFLCLGIFLLFGGYFNFASITKEAINLLMLFGLFLLCTGYYIEPTPLLNLPKDSKKILRGKTKNAYPVYKILTVLFLAPFAINIASYFTTKISINFNLAVLGLIGIILLLLIIKFTKGMQRQLKPMILGFLGLFTAYIAFALQNLLASDLRFEALTASQGILWILGNILIFTGFFFVGRYGLSFMRFRLKPQLFVNFISSSLIIFFSVTIVFILVLLNDFETNTLSNLRSSSKAIEIAIVDQRNDSILAAKALNGNASVNDAIYREDSNALKTATEDILNTSGADFITITNEAGLSIYETLNPSARGTNFSNDKYLIRAIEGDALNTLVTEEGVLAPRLIIKTYIPTVKDEKVTGVIIVGFIIDNQLVDSLKEKTGLDVTLFVNNIRSATTFTADNGTQRMVGTLEEDKDVIEQVLKNGETYQGGTKVFNVEYLSVYSPLKDDDGNIIGMIFVGEPSKVLFAIAQESTQTTLKIMSLLILLSLIPTYFFVKRTVMSQMI